MYSLNDTNISFIIVPLIKQRTVFVQIIKKTRSYIHNSILKEQSLYNTFVKVKIIKIRLESIRMASWQCQSDQLADNLGYFFSFSH